MSHGRFRCDKFPLLSLPGTKAPALLSPLVNGNSSHGQRRCDKLPVLSLPGTEAGVWSGGVAGMVEGLAPKERRLPPPECLRVWVGGVVDEGDGRETILREKKTRLASVMF